MASKGKKILLIILAVIVLIVLIFGVSMWRAGVFASAEVFTDQRGPFNFVYLERTGPFSEIPAAHNTVDSLFQNQNIKKGLAAGMYLDDPAMVQSSEMRWRVGYLVEDSLVVEPPLEFIRIHQKEFLIATIKANPMVAPFKTYPALKEYRQKNSYKTGNYALEIYYEDGHIEAMFPAAE